MSHGEGDRRSQSWSLGREMSTQLHLCLKEFLPPQQWSDLAFLAVAKGPGGFTGTRLGVVTARTLAQQLDVPLFAISTLAALGWATWQKSTGTSGEQAADRAVDVAIAMPARRGEVFGAIYRFHVSQGEGGRVALLDWEPRFEDTAMPQETWQKTLDEWPDPLQQISAPDGLGWTTPALLELAYQQWNRGDRPHWSTALPYYGQSPV